VPGDALPTDGEVFRAESGRVIGALMRRFGDLDLAEDAYQDACLAAVETWPRDGVPTSPGAWLTTVAGNRALDRLRREAGRLPREVAALGLRPDDPLGPVSPAADEELDLDFGPAALADDQLRLLFLCCHPALAEDAQVALTLRTVGGLTTAEIARAFLVPEPTMAQRLVRAKRKISVAGIPFRMPPPEELPERLAAVLHVVYLVFNEGYAATTTDSVVRTDLCDEALRLADLLAQLCPDDAEVLGLRALLVLHDARRPGRVSADGRLVPLAEQDRSRWDHRRIERGSTLVEEALRTGPVGPYQLEAAIAALHAEARTYEETDWSQIVALYGLLERSEPGPLVELNRAVALAMRDGPRAGLAELDRIDASGALSSHHRLPAARAHLLEELGRPQEAAAAYDEAIALVASPAERAYLVQRRDRVRAAHPNG
jgi:RNA polymerase sigma-70 factor, ECF subfamily